MVLTNTRTVNKRTLSSATTTCKPQSCSSCDGPSCMERPRYFCGQLLTDRDLDSAQRYVIEKNKLHNRYLVGSGVACGLAVHCDPCDGVVVIEPGYAIDCCGNDILVCEPFRFDVLGYINACLRGEEPGCNGKIRTRPPTACDDRPREYCLTISYSEEQTRPVTALMSGANCNTSRCEPSRTSEIFRFDLEERDPKEKQGLGGIWGRLQACILEVWASLREYTQEIVAAAQIENRQEAHNRLFDIFCRMKDYVLGLYQDGPQMHCNLQSELDDIEAQFPLYSEDPEQLNVYLVQLYRAMFAMLAWIFRYMIDCICEALLVPCGECGQDQGVLLACLTVCDGKVQDICNTVRTQIISGPALGYYLQPLFDGLRLLVERLCCEFDPTDISRQLSRQSAGFDTLNSAFGRSEATFNMARDFSAAAISQLNLSNLMQYASPQRANAVDLYNRPASEARATLERMNVSVVERKAATKAEAYNLRNLAGMSWAVTPGKRVELLLDPQDRVTGMRILGEADQ
jgi:hypothetical protein